MNKLHEYRTAHGGAVAAAMTDYSASRMSGVPRESIYGMSRRKYQETFLNEPEPVYMYWYMVAILSAPMTTCKHCHREYAVVDMYSEDSHFARCLPAQVRSQALAKLWRRRLKAPAGLTHLG